MVWTTAQVRPVTLRGGEQAIPPQPLTLSQLAWPLRVRVFCMRLEGQLATDSWLMLVFQLLHYIFISFACQTTACHWREVGIQHWRDTGQFFSSMRESIFFGLPMMLWLVVVSVTFLFCRRPTAQALSGLQRCLAQMQELDSHPACSKSLHTVIWKINCLHIVIPALILASHFVYFCTTHNASGSSGITAASFLQAMSGSVVQISIMHIPSKFHTISVMVTSGFTIVHKELERLAELGDEPTLDAIIQLRNFHVRFSKIYSHLTSKLSVELFLVMTVGVINEVHFFLFFLNAAYTGQTSPLNSLSILILLGVTMSLIVPCQASQGVLNAVERTRTCLLELQWTSWEVDREVRRMLDAVCRDLETLGDLGLFRLKGSTILTATATIATYSIVILQFLASENDANH